MIEVAEQWNYFKDDPPNTFRSSVDSVHWNSAIRVLLYLNKTPSLLLRTLVACKWKLMKIGKVEFFFWTIIEFKDNLKLQNNDSIGAYTSDDFNSQFNFKPTIEFKEINFYVIKYFKVEILMKFIENDWLQYQTKISLRN